jgi:beta-N-acetylhexosaminidase
VLCRQLAALGFNIDFAPVLDVDSRPDSPVIGDRSFGSDPERVARHGIAFARGLRAAGVASCGKHFPGHGDAALDSHLDLPRVAHPRERLDQVELWPFRTAAHHLDSIMTAHMVFDALEADRPATLSGTILQGLLRGTFGFTGVIFSDDLEMKAIADRYEMTEAACEAVLAGCDVLLVCSDEALCLRVHEALAQRAAREPALRMALEAAAGRSRALRARLAPHPGRATDMAAQLRALSDASLEALLARAATP